jgi:hypothetical protein
MKTKILLLWAVMAFAFTVSSCKEDGNSLKGIIGTWEQMEDYTYKTRVTFYENNTFGIYVLTDNGEWRYDNPIFSITTWKIDGDVLIFPRKYDNEETIDYKYQFSDNGKLLYVDLINKRDPNSDTCNYSDNLITVLSPSGTYKRVE